MNTTKQGLILFRWILIIISLIVLEIAFLWKVNVWGCWFGILMYWIGFFMHRTIGIYHELHKEIHSKD